MKSNKVKLRGRLRKSLYWPMFMTILLICMNVVIYMDAVSYTHLTLPTT